MNSLMVILAPGFEEIEAVAPIDLLRRAGLKVGIAGLGSREAEGSHAIRVKADFALCPGDSLPQALPGGGFPEGLIFPGGMPGAANLAASPEVLRLIAGVRAADGLIAAICAAPGVLLGPTGLLEGRRVTCYPGYEKYLGAGAVWVPDPVVADGNLITARSAGAAIDFALEIIAYCRDRAASDKAAAAILYEPRGSRELPI
ncbi:MAG: DJ-1/PfpI family protein [Spirochaetales bacterium]|jgi:4-methyl-5(b-hydroxyethyl)-thiazole monophosphate biosynthesis|nr:DJ-1/PfpI family protein [Spirochaetales bacterium]